MKVTLSPRTAIQPVVQSESQEKPQTSAEKRENARQDSVALSRQALEHIRQQQAERSAAQKEKMARSTDIFSMIQDSNAQADAQAEGMEIEFRCLKISRNVMSGDRVPQKDLQYLMEHNPDLYRMAILMKKIKKDPEDCEKVIQDEDEESAAPASDASASDASAPEVSAPEPESGGGSAE